MGGRHVIRRIIHHCITCRKASSRTISQRMADPPFVRLTPARTFSSPIMSGKLYDCPTSDQSTQTDEAKDDITKANVGGGKENSSPKYEENKERRFVLVEEDNKGKEFSRENTGKESSRENTGKEYLKEAGWIALKTAAVSTAVLGGVAVAVPLLGFGAAGVTAGSLAATYQSVFLGGTIASGSAFAALQSIGAAGLAISSQAGVVAGSAVLSAATSARRLLKNDIQSENENLPSNAEISDCDSKHASKKDVSTQTESVISSFRNKI